MLLPLHWIFIIMHAVSLSITFSCKWFENFTYITILPFWSLILCLITFTCHFYHKLLPVFIMIFTCILDSATVGQILYTCPGVSERSPQTSGFICRKTLTLSALPVPFQHNDKYVLLNDDFFTLLEGTITVYRGSLPPPPFISHPSTLANRFPCLEFA